MSKQLRLNVLLPFVVMALLVVGPGFAHAAPQTASSAVPGGCDFDALSKSKTEFLRLSSLLDVDQRVVTDEDLRQASTDYITKAESCYQALYGGSATTHSIDDGGVWFSADGSQPFATPTPGTKWGAGSPFSGGINVPGPRIAGGTVTYSFMTNGVDISAEGPTPGPSVAISSLPTYSSCFLTEISNALAAWSAVANIQFVQVADNGLPFNAPGAAGDIRIAAHTFDGPSSVLAHGYYPPPNGTSAAGDVHFDRQENWSCTPGSGIDFGIVAMHEFGHAIGLSHENTNTAVMNPSYNPSITAPLADDINGASSIYGSPPVASSSRFGDFDGDGKSDVTVYRPSTGYWYILPSAPNTPTASHQWGVSTDEPVSGDYDGDGKSDIAIFRPSTGIWYVLPSIPNRPVATHALGGSGDVPVPRDYDGDGRTDIAMFRPSTGLWQALFSSTNFTSTGSTQWGVSTDIATPGDYDGDRRSDVAIYRPSTGTWWVLPSNTPAFSAQWGVSTDTPVAADYDGDGKTDIAIYRPSIGTWYILPSTPNRPVISTVWGVSTDLPVPADYDGDGKTDIAVYRPSDGKWYILGSATNTAIVHTWGISTDIPISE